MLQRVLPHCPEVVVGDRLVLQAGDVEWVVGMWDGEDYRRVLY